MARELAATTEEAAKNCASCSSGMLFRAVGCYTVFYWLQKREKRRGFLNVKIMKHPNQRLVKLLYPFSSKHTLGDRQKLLVGLLHSLQCAPLRTAQEEMLCHALRLRDQSLSQFIWILCTSDMPDDKAHKFSIKLYGREVLPSLSLYQSRRERETCKVRGGLASSQGISHSTGNPSTTLHPAFQQSGHPVSLQGWSFSSSQKEMNISQMSSVGNFKQLESLQNYSLQPRDTAPEIQQPQIKVRCNWLVSQEHQAQASLMKLR